MIKTGIAGADSPVAGEVIRLLVNHPDVELAVACAPSQSGKRLSEYHYGLIGETELRFADTLQPDKLDALIVCAPDAQASAVMASPEKFPNLKIIDMTHSELAKRGNYQFGLSELYRKPLVRGERLAYVPYPEEVIALAALYPPATRLLLSGDIAITLHADAQVVPAERQAIVEEAVGRHLRQAQLSFSGNVKISRGEPLSRRAIRAVIDLPLALSLEEAEETFESIYDDHNFTFHMRRQADTREVEGTHKTIITLEKRDGALRITATADALMRGGASEAVHLLNLLFGLHERTGLALKASADYDRALD